MLHRERARERAAKVLGSFFKRARGQAIQFGMDEHVQPLMQHVVNECTRMLESLATAKGEAADGFLSKFSDAQQDF